MPGLMKVKSDPGDQELPPKMEYIGRQLYRLGAPKESWTLDSSLTLEYLTFWLMGCTKQKEVFIGFPNTSINLLIFVCCRLQGYFLTIRNQHLIYGCSGVRELCHACRFFI